MYDCGKVGGIIYQACIQQRLNFAYINKLASVPPLLNVSSSSWTIIDPLHVVQTNSYPFKSWLLPDESRVEARIQTVCHDDKPFVAMSRMITLYICHVEYVSMSTKCVAAIACNCMLLSMLTVLTLRRPNKAHTRSRLCSSYSAAAEAQKGLYLRSYPYRRYNKLILV